MIVAAVLPHHVSALSWSWRCYLLTTCTPSTTLLVVLLVAGTTTKVQGGGTVTTNCFGYITSDRTFTPDTSPLPIDCSGSGSSQTYPGWGPPELQALACCNDAGRFAVHTSNIGGFDVTFDTRTPSAECLAYSSALQSVLCDPRQGQFITADKTTDPQHTTPILSICRASCDAVYANCGPPGIHFSPQLTYTDGTTFCSEAWGGFFVDVPCDNEYDGFPCQSGLQLNVTTINCIDMVYPTDETIEAYRTTGDPPDACKLNSNQPILRKEFVILISAIVAFVLISVLVVSWGRWRSRDMDTDPNADMEYK